MSWAPLALWLVEDEAGANLAELVFAKLGYGWFGLLVPAAIGAYLYAARRRQQAVESLGNPELVARLISTVDPGKRLIRALLAVAGLSGIIKSD